MTKTVNLDDAKKHLSALVEEAAGGAEIVIAKNGKPRARLVPLPGIAAERPEPGLFKGQIWMSPDFDDPLPDDLLRLFNEGDEDDPLREDSPR